MGARVRAHDWSSTPLGPPSAWPQALRTALGVVLGTTFPALLVWGHDLTCFHNDAFLRFPGTGPRALGRPFKEVWPETWEAIGPVAARALSGEPGHFDDLPLTLERDGRPEETWWTFSYSPVFAETGEVGGVLATVHETTDRVAAERRLRFLVEVGARLRDLTDPREVTAAAVAMLGRHLGAGRAALGSAPCWERV